MSDDDLTSYSLEVERLELVLDSALADLRRTAGDGDLHPTGGRPGAVEGPPGASGRP